MLCELGPVHWMAVPSNAHEGSSPYSGSVHGSRPWQPLAVICATVEPA